MSVLQRVTTAMPTRRLAVGLLATASITTCAIGGVAAIAASTQKPVKACATKADALSLLTHGKCSKGSHQVSLGARGPKGAPGTNGSNGSSTVYFNYLKGTQTNSVLGESMAAKTVAVSLALPAGTYSVEFHVDLYQLDGSTNLANGFCQLGNGSIRRGAVLYGDDESSPDLVPAGGQVAGDDVVTLATAGTLAVNCWASAPHIEYTKDGAQTITAFPVTKVLN